MFSTKMSPNKLSWTQNIMDQNILVKKLIYNGYLTKKLIITFFPCLERLFKARTFLSRIFFRTWFSAQNHHYKSLPPCSVRGVSLVLDNRLMTIIGESEANSFSTSVNIQFLEKELHRYPFFFLAATLEKRCVLMI